MTKQYRVTSLGMSPAEDRAHRMRVYFIAMTLRVLCILSLFFVRGWWIAVAAAGAVLLPYFAVMIANAVSHVEEPRPDAPEPLQLESSAAGSAGDDTEERDPDVIVIDAPAERRRSKPQHDDDPEEESA